VNCSTLLLVLVVTLFGHDFLLLFHLWPLYICKLVGRLLSEKVKDCVEVDESAQAVQICVWAGTSLCRGS